MKNSVILLFLVIICILFSCQKGNSNKPASTTSNIPSSIIYQDLDTTTGNYITTQTFNLFPDSNGIYFDSIGFSVDSVSFFLFPFNHLLYNTKKYMTFNSNPSTDSSVSLIKFDNNNRISKLHDFYNLSTDATLNLGDWSNNEFEYSSFSTSNTFLSHFASIDVSGSISDFSYNFDVIAANNDSMNIISGKNHDAFFDRQIKYTVLFDTKDNNCNLIPLSGIIQMPFGNINSNTSQMFYFLSKIPLPKLNTKLAKSVYITEVAGGDPIFGGFAAYVKYADFAYEFDTDNRVTIATIKTYYSTELGSLIPIILTKRILFTY